MDSEKKPEQPKEQEAVFTTIVGGRPPGSGARVGNIPRGVEVLLKKASVDAEFCKLLLEKRAEAARAIDLELTEAEREMLAQIPAAQLEQIIRNTKVKPEHRAVFLGTVGALMLAAVVIGINAVGSHVMNRFQGLPATLGHTIEMPEQVDVAPENAGEKADAKPSDPNLPAPEP